MSLVCVYVRVFSTRNVDLYTCGDAVSGDGRNEMCCWKTCSFRVQRETEIAGTEGRPVEDGRGRAE